MKLSDLVARLRSVAPYYDQAYLTRLVRYWTSAGLLGPEDELRDRARRHRRYDDRHLYRAAVLVELSSYGIPQVIMRHAAEWLMVREPEYRRMHGSDPFEDALNGHTIAIVFATLRSRGGDLHGWITMGRDDLDEIVLPGCASWLTIDLSAILARLD